MTEEQNSYSAPEPSSAPPPQELSNAEGSSNPGEPGQGRRRRRRKRKGTRAAAQAQNSQQTAQPPQQNNPQNNGGQNAGGQQNGPQNNGYQNGGGQQNNGQSQGKSKRFFRKARNNQGGGGGQNANPGNNIGNGGGMSNGMGNGMGNGGGGRRRQSKQRRQPAAFVGPMDHSYRTANGNIADGPPSTIQLQNGGNYGNHYGSGGNFRGDYNGNVNYAQSYGADSAVVIREDAPTRIYCYIEDLFFLAKIQETSRKLGIRVEFVKGERDLLSEVAEMTEDKRPALIVFDLNNVNAKPLTLIPKLRSKLKKTTSIIGFVSHLQGDLKMKATEAGCDAVMPRSAFSQNLPNLLRRYGLEDDVEENETQLA